MKSLANCSPIDEYRINEIKNHAKILFGELSDLDDDSKIDVINQLKIMLHELSPFKDEPVDCVLWVKNDMVVANDYNPNKVAPPEMKLLELSIVNDGYTQPIVSWTNTEKDKIEVIDGFHRNRIGKESKVVSERVRGYLPIVDIRTKQSNKNDRIASTIRHNRARGKHQIDAMSEIVIELKNRNWRNARIANELGMDEEEVLRLCQISGLEDLFSDRDFSNAWESDDSQIDWEDLTDQIDEEHILSTRIPNEGKGDRIFHTFDKWECNKAGFYASNVEGKTADQCKEEYRDFLADLDRFRNAAMKVISEWRYSCEHYLTNFAMNRIAWIGQAAMCYETGVPSKFCGGFNLLTDEQQDAANEVALDALNQWLSENGREKVEMDEALSLGRQVEIY
jgi:ParB-like chromosome segregation protein Spo0J